jgi:hypothetical protein
MGYKFSLPIFRSIKVQYTTALTEEEIITRLQEIVGSYSFFPVPKIFGAEPADIK